MPHRNLPICDTDIIIKVIKADVHDLLYSKFSMIHYSDAVYQEIDANCNRIKASKKTIRPYFIRAKRIIDHDYHNKSKVLNLNEVDPRRRKVILSKLMSKGIIYDESNCKYQLEPDCGELVTLIYASVLGYTLILSDDNRFKTEIKRNPRLKWWHLRKVFQHLEIDEKILEDEIFIANSIYPERARVFLDELNSGDRKSVV